MVSDLPKGMQLVSGTAGTGTRLATVVCYIFQLTALRKDPLGAQAKDGKLPPTGQVWLPVSLYK